VVCPAGFFDLLKLGRGDRRRHDTVGEIHSYGQVAGSAQFFEHIDVLQVAKGDAHTSGGVHSYQAYAVGFLKARPVGVEYFLTGGAWNRVRHDSIRGIFFNCPGGFAGPGVSYKLAAGRVGRFIRDACQLERFRVGPLGVAVE
jgi:hypothetical protein